MCLCDYFCTDRTQLVPQRIIRTLHVRTNRDSILPSQHTNPRLRAGLFSPNNWQHEIQIQTSGHGRLSLLHHLGTSFSPICGRGEDPLALDPPPDFPCCTTVLPSGPTVTVVCKKPSDLLRKSSPVLRLDETLLRAFFPSDWRGRQNQPFCMKSLALPTAGRVPILRRLVRWAEYPSLST